MPASRASDYKYTALRPPALLYQFIDLLFEIPLNIAGVYYPIFHFFPPFLADSLLPSCYRNQKKDHKMPNYTISGLFCLISDALAAYPDPIVSLAEAGVNRMYG